MTTHELKELERYLWIKQGQKLDGIQIPDIVDLMRTNFCDDEVIKIDDACTVLNRMLDNGDFDGLNINTSKGLKIWLSDLFRGQLKKQTIKK